MTTNSHLREWVGEWATANTFVDVESTPRVGCALPYELRRQRMLDRLMNWSRYHQPQPVFLPPALYDWLERELNAQN